MPYIEDLLTKKLMFEFKQLGEKWGVFEQIKKEDVTLLVGCVYIGTAVDCRKYVEQRRSKQALKEEERKSFNSFIQRREDGVIYVG